MSQILLLHGPNLNLLGTRDPTHYGHQTLADIDQQASQIAATNGYSLMSFQSNAESALIERVQAAASDGTQFIVINPAAFTHTSVALRDALAAIGLPFIEVHLSNVHARESFRRHSYFSDLAMGVIAGFGAKSYDLALQVAIAHLESNKSEPTND